MKRRFALVATLILSACASDVESAPDTDHDAPIDAVSEDVGNDVSPDASSDAHPDIQVAADAADSAPTLARCNGHAVLCDRPFDQVVLAGTHNSMASDEDTFVPPNQTVDIAAQLADGIRGFLIDVHFWREAYWLCHSMCEIGRLPAVEELATITTFLEAHPNEVIAIVFQNEISANEMTTLLEESGLAAYAMTPPPEETDWPTLSEMIEANTRAVMTLESGASDAPWLPNAWSLFVDTPYSFDSVEAFNCDENRGRANNDLFLINHWISAPLSHVKYAREANVDAVLTARVEECEATFGRLPNILAVDFHDVGDLLSVVDRLNGVNE